jgi:hypothetical protein
MVLTDEQISTLDEHLDEFRACDYDIWEIFVRAFVRNFQNDCPQDIRFDYMTVATVRAPSATLGCSHIFVAYSPVPLWHN